MNDNNLTIESPAIWEEKNSIEPEKKSESNGVLDECGIITNTKELNGNEPSIDITKERKKISGIYKIVNNTNNKYYIGSSNNIHKRWNYHKEDLRRKNHHCQYLQRSWNKYGKDNFDFVIIEENIPEKDLLITEQKYLDVAKLEKNKCFNGSFTAGRIQFTDEIRKKISIGLIGNQCKKGRKASNETRKRMSEAQKLVDRSDYGKNRKGIKLAEGHKQKLRELAIKQFKNGMPEETKKKMSEAAKKRWERKRLNDNKSLVS